MGFGSSAARGSYGADARPPSTDEGGGTEAEPPSKRRCLTVSPAVTAAAGGAAQGVGAGMVETCQLDNHSPHGPKFVLIVSQIDEVDVTISLGDVMYLGREQLSPLNQFVSREHHLLLVRTPYLATGASPTFEVSACGLNDIFVGNARLHSGPSSISSGKISFGEELWLLGNPHKRELCCRLAFAD
jgi:hypothetical protein